MAVVWHVDDQKVSQNNAFEITKLAGYLDNSYRALKVNHRKVHNYRSVNLDFSEDGNVKVSRIPYLNEVLHDFSELLGDIAKSLSADHLFQVRPDNEA